jgi:hypothetical protein
MTRLGGNFSMYGRPASVTLSSSSTTSTRTSLYQKIYYYFTIFWILRVVLLMMIALVDPNIERERTEWIEPPATYYFFAIIDEVLAYGYFAYTVLLLWNLRSHVRSRYSIPQGDTCPAGCDDVCCSLWCPCFVVSQMLRHTTDYERHSARCCSANGVAPSSNHVMELSSLRRS